jgi:hypothetical protein
MRLVTTDRVDNNKGYSLENCVAACFECNRIKSNKFTETEMMLIGKTLSKVYKVRTNN